MKKYTNLLSCAAIALVMIVACTKTADLPARAQSNILSFAITNLPDTVIYGAVDNTDKTITVYLPFYYNLNIIDPQIKVSEGARILEELLPVDIADSTQQYTVKGKDSSTTVYKLKIRIQAPGVPFTLIEHSTADNYYVTNPGYSQFSFGGSFYTTNSRLINAWLVNSEGEETSLQLNGVFAQNDNSTGEMAYWLTMVPIPATLDSGLYYVKASVYDRTVTMQYPIRISYQQPDFGYFTTREVKQGGTFILTAHTTSGKVFTEVKSFAMSTDGVNWLPLPLESYTREEATVKVPEDFPIGQYNHYRMEFNTWNTQTHAGSFTTIVAK